MQIINNNSSNFWSTAGYTDLPRSCFPVNLQGHINLWHVIIYELYVGCWVLMTLSFSLGCFVKTEGMMQRIVSRSFPAGKHAAWHSCSVSEHIR